MKPYFQPTATVFQYAVAVASLAAATVFRWLLDPALGNHLPYVTYFVAVAIVAWYSGVWVSAVTMLAGWLVADYFFVPPRGTFIWHGSDPVFLVGTLTYFMVAVATILVSSAMHAARQRAETHREALRVTLASIGDAVITTDNESRVAYLNAVAETLTGWKQIDAEGRPLDEVFRIVNEGTRQPAENPAMRALKEGVIVGLANHTVLIRRDNTETAIDDSASPIQNEQGDVVGAVLIFRDISEQRAATRALEESEARKAAILNTALDGLITIDHRGMVIEFNPAAEQVFGYSRDEALGREMAELIIPPKFRDQHRQGIAHFLRTGEGPLLNRRVEVTAVRADSTEFPVEVSITPTTTGDFPTFTGHIRDLTERRRIEQRLATQYIVSRALAETNTLRDSASRILQAIGEHLSWEVGALWFVDRHENRLRCAEVYHSPHVQALRFEAVCREHSFERGVGLPGRVWASGKAAWIPDVVHDANFPRASVADAEGLHAAFGFPILLDHEVLGVIEFFSHEIRQPDEDLLQMMTSIGSQLGQVIHRRRAEEALRATERRLAAVVENSDDAIVTKTLDGIVRSWNAGAERMFGYSAAEAVGKHVTFIIPPDRAFEEDRIIARLRAGERVDHFDTVRVRKNGEAIHVSLSISPITDDEGRVVGASKIARNITERKRMEDRLRQTAADLSEADRRKNEFLAMLAHELRNPLAPIRNAVQIMKLAANRQSPHVADETIQSASAMMERQIGQMVRLIDDLLDISRISRGTIELRRERVELASIVHHAVEAARSLIDCMEQEISVILPPETILLDADPTRIAQVIGNLLNNACKFTNKGGRIELTVEVEEEKENAVIRVRDNGIGIAPDQLPRIFDMFTQIDTSLERTVSGLGIGLTLVKNLVEMHGGTVDATSAGLGKGSEFVVRLPVTNDTGAEKTSIVPDKKRQAGPPRRILIVDDNQDAARSLAALLRLAGHETHTAFDGLEAIEVAAERRPDVVLLDIGLPKLNGYEAARRLRNETWATDVVLIALTGWGQEEDRQKSIAAGFNAHLVKPVDFNALQRLLADDFTAPDGRPST
jgi:PAS domain S-box-containing protein